MIIAIDRHQNVSINGEPVTLPVLELMLAEQAANAQLRVSVKVAPDTPMGLVSKIQQLIPATTTEVSYPLPEE